jgi:tRNA U38,U39,U40 pseudouridine synthase TruA
MLEVGEGKRGPEVIAQLLKENDNSNVSRPAPPHGLFLEKVEYPRHLYLDPQ